MNYLFIFKRFEIWLLLGVVVALLIFAFQPVEEEAVAINEEATEVIKAIKAIKVDEPLSAEVSEDEVPGFKITEVKVEPTQQGQVVELTLLAQSKSEENLFVNEKTLKAKTDSGLEVPYFFEPFRLPQIVGPDEDSLVTVRLWLSSPAESIWLDFQGERAEAELPEKL